MASVFLTLSVRGFIDIQLLTIVKASFYFLFRSDGEFAETEMAVSSAYRSNGEFAKTEMAVSSAYRCTMKCDKPSRRSIIKMTNVT